MIRLNKLANRRFNYIFVFGSAAIALLLFTIAAKAAGCTQDVSTHGCRGNPPSHYLQFYNGCSRTVWVQMRMRWYETGQCEQGGSEPVAPGDTGSINVGLCSQGRFVYRWRSCFEAGCALPPCPDLR